MMRPCISRTRIIYLSLIYISWGSLISFSSLDFRLNRARERERCWRDRRNSHDPNGWKTSRSDWIPPFLWTIINVNPEVHNPNEHLLSYYSHWRNTREGEGERNIGVQHTCWVMVGFLLIHSEWFSAFICFILVSYDKMMMTWLNRQWFSFSHH